MLQDLSVQEQEECARKKVQELIDSCPRCNQSPDDIRQIRKAFELANDAHRGMRRKSGELYIFHPVAVATVAAVEIGLGPTSIAAALLHDVVEDTDITLQDLEKLFGPKVASIVDGLTKLEGVFDQNASLQAENFRKLLVSMIEDVRVILLKLADRLHNMRTLDSMPEHKRYRIAAETLYIYAPVAHRLGLFAIKTELEDLSLKYEHPQIYASLSAKLLSNQDEYERSISLMAKPIREQLDAAGVQYEIKARTKSVYSIWRKMQAKQVPFEEIYDISAMRIVFKPKSELSEKTQCWAIYSVVTDLYKPKPDRLRDWISVPKANGYEALHTTVMGPEGRWVEVQIRSERMDEIAERGFAAHWKYKASEAKESEIDNWLNSIREMLENHDSDSLEFLDNFKLNLFASEIMVFTPHGEVKVMPVGSTALDFAFEIHTKLGYHCIGAKVNYKLEPLSHELRSGDQVEIITSDKQTPKYEWLDFVATAKAKTCIREAFKEERKQYIQQGEQLLNEQLQLKHLSINNRILKKLMKYFHLETREDIYFQLGKGMIKLDNMEKILAQKSTNKWVKYWRLTFGGADDDADDDADTVRPKVKNVVLTDDNLTDYVIAECCNPIPGDDVVAYCDDSGKLVLHSRKCPTAIRLMASRGDRIISTQWVSHKILSYLVILSISGIDRQGIVSELTKIISLEQNVNMRSVHFESHDGVFDGNIYLYIHNTADLNLLIDKISKVKGVHNVLRKERTETDNKA